MASPATGNCRVRPTSASSPRSPVARSPSRTIRTSHVSRLNDLLRRLEATDPALAKDLRQEYDALADRRAFGLNFERHTPEVVELPGRTVRKGDKVHILPE